LSAQKHLIADVPTPAAQVSTAINGTDFGQIANLHDAYPEIFAGKSALGPILNKAAIRAPADTIKFLLELGLDPNVGHAPFGENALAVAARKGRLEIVKILRKAGAKLDTSEPTRNPLVAVASSNSVDVAQYLLDEGIDATISYSGQNYQGMTAASLALESGAIDVARTIVLHIARGDRARAQDLLLEAYETVNRNNPDARSYPPPPTL